MSSSRLAALSSERMPWEAERTAIGGSPSVGRGSVRAATGRRLSGDRGARPLAREAARGPQQVADARVARGVALERGRVRRIPAQQPRTVGPAYELVAFGQLAQRGRHGRP